MYIAKTNDTHLCYHFKEIIKTSDGPGTLQKEKVTGIQTSFKSQKIF